MRLALALALVFAAAPALAFEEPDSFRGIKWGTSQEEARDILGKAWRERASVAPHDYPSCPIATVCSQKGTLGPVPVTFLYAFKDDKFVSGIVQFKPADYESVRRIFDERYGPPTWRRQQEVRSKAGVPHENEISMWRGSKVSVVLRRYSRRLDEGDGGVTVNTHAEEGSAERDKALKKGKDDL